jgi:hypothetical protein
VGNGGHWEEETRRLARIWVWRRRLRALWSDTLDMWVYVGGIEAWISKGESGGEVSQDKAVKEVESAVK